MSSSPGGPLYTGEVTLHDKLSSALSENEGTVAFPSLFTIPDLCRVGEL